MRLDLFLKASRLVTRRSIAKQLCDAGRIKVNDLAARASKEIKVCDTIELRRGKHLTVVRVAILPPSKQVRRDEAADLFEIVEDTRLTDDILS
ncbi:MAG TPA: S4 domain-containing protein [Pyrinomonadaceae bacterium]|jgi:ribosomal 50S subunit-recycling heat shock protein